VPVRRAPAPDDTRSYVSASGARPLSFGNRASAHERSQNRLAALDLSSAAQRQITVALAMIEHVNSQRHAVPGRPRARFA
jgi:hypothetical protein